MAKASWNGVVIAESPTFETVEGNVYFPPSSIKSEYFTQSFTHTQCPWKGAASYYNVTVNGAVNKDCAWYYPDPKPAAANIKGYVSFYKGVVVEKI